jgi:hypothetical protein
VGLRISPWRCWLGSVMGSSMRGMVEKSWGKLTNLASLVQWIVLWRMMAVCDRSTSKVCGGRCFLLCGMHLRHGWLWWQQYLLYGMVLYLHNILSLIRPCGTSICPHELVGRVRRQKNIIPYP